MAARKTFQKAPLANFTTNIKHRDIVIEASNFNVWSDTVFDIIVDVNKEIHNLALAIPNRHIPFIIGNTVSCINIQNPDPIRIVIRGHSVPYQIHYKPKKSDSNSHTVEYQISTSYNQITFSNSTFDAKLVIDEKHLATAITDLFLDLVMFNSYSFLRNMSIDEKRQFSKQKFDFFKANNLDCYYTYDETDDLLYYSIAFSARTSEKNIDFQRYIALWDKFIATYYPNKTHIEGSLEQQLREHFQHGQLKTSLILSELQALPSGTYLLIKINKGAKNPKTVSQLAAIFGKSSPTSRDWKIIPFTEYASIKNLLLNQKISGFKLIK